MSICAQFASLNKAMKSDAIDSASLAHGFAILCASAAPLLHRLWRRYESRRVQCGGMPMIQT